MFSKEKTEVQERESRVYASFSRKVYKGRKRQNAGLERSSKVKAEDPTNGIVIISPLNSLHIPSSQRLISDLCQGLGLFKLLLQMSFFPPRLCPRSSLGLIKLPLPQVWGQHFSCLFFLLSCLDCSEFHFSLFCSLEQRQQAAGCRVVEGSSSL